jgi:IclR family pca regulon transcriptional regulator
MSEPSVREVARPGGLVPHDALGVAGGRSRVARGRPRVLELGRAYLSSLSLNEVAAPHLEQLVARVAESSSVAVLDGDDIACVVRVPTRRIMAMSIAVGTRFPAYATSMGRVLLAGLPAAELDAYLSRVVLIPLTRRTVTDPEHLRRELGAVAAQGYALMDQELAEGLRSIAVPIVDSSRRVVAALNVSTHVSRATLETLRCEVLPVLAATGRAISAGLAALGPSAGQVQPR